jgi:uncharacterized protein (TIGR02588 family)
VGERKHRDALGKTPLLEWLAAAVGALLAAGLVAFLVADAVDGDQAAPPLLVVTAESLHAEGGMHVVKLKVANRSSRAASSVQVEGELMAGDAPIDSAQATVDFVPGRSTRQAGLIFREDPRRFRLEVRAVGFELP